MTTPHRSEQVSNPANRVKVAHLVSGLVFLGVAATWLLHATGVLDSVGVGVAFPVVLVAAGVVGLAAIVAGRGRRTPRTESTPHDTHLEENQ